MDSLFDQCQFPDLDEPYATALREAVRFILGYVEPVAIIAAGSIIRGNPNPNSDFDLYVLHRQPRRQRVQRWFNGVPTEIFINPPDFIPTYFADEGSEGHPSTAHMFATGSVVFDVESVIEPLRAQAREALAQPPNPSSTQLTLMRYGAADMLENALDIRDTAPENARILLCVAVMDMLKYAYLKAGRHLPRHKDMLAQLSGLDAELADLAFAFYRTSGDEAFELAGKIADKTIATRGFFEWESDWQDV